MEGSRSRKNYENVEGTKFQDMQRKWLSGTPGPGPGPSRSPEPQATTTTQQQHPAAAEEELDRLLAASVIRVPSGSTPVRSLTGRFDNGHHHNGHHHNGSPAATASEVQKEAELRALVVEQRRQIDGLRREVGAKDRRIRELEEKVRRIDAKEQ